MSPEPASAPPPTSTPHARVPRLSVLDLVPVRTGQSSAAAIAASRALAAVADRSGFERYWVAEHHNMPAVAATNPPVVIAMLAAATERIRVGSGGVMLPNHAPLVIAEQFALLEAAFPGRIDLGIGRAPGTDPVTGFALRHGGPAAEGDEAVARFAEYVGNVVAMMSPAGVGLQIGGRTHELRATPDAASVPEVWLLGSSDYSARLAAQRGLPYVFAHHFSGEGTHRALDLYRSTFEPSEHLAAPRTFLTVNAVVAATGAEARRLARPYQLMMLALRSGAPLRALMSVEEAEAVELSASHQSFIDATLARWVVDEPGAAREQVASLAEEFGVDEVMVHPVAGASEGTPLDRTPAREQTLSLLTDVSGNGTPDGAGAGAGSEPIRDSSTDPLD